MSHPLISIIVASYNQEPYIDACLESIYKQSYPHWECIIVDDASPDQSVQLAENWVKRDPRFTLIQLSENAGVSTARNRGLQEMKGEYFQFLDSDDIIQSDKLLTQLQQFEPQLITVSGNRYFYHEEGITKLRVMGKNGALPEVVFSKWDKTDLLDIFNSKNPFVVSAPIFPKEVLSKVGFFNEKLNAFEDWEFNFRCALAGYKFHHVGYGENSMVLVRIHKQSMTTRTEEMLQYRREFNFSIRSNSEYQAYFGVKPTLKDRPGAQAFRTLLKSLVPPIVFTLLRKVRGN